ncbi:hypothetical protein [uncultured Gammaproteobacteria bacterium]|nr:hypothetical protein [uncultured Gammaproteobacteria bacterium]
MNFVGYFSKTFWVFYGCFRWVLFYQIGGFLVGLCKGLLGVECLGNYLGVEC